MLRNNRAPLLLRKIKVKFSANQRQYFTQNSFTLQIAADQEQDQVMTELPWPITATA